MPGGDSGPGPGVWVENYLGYFLDMKAGCIRAMAMPDPAPLNLRIMIMYLTVGN